MVNVVIDKTDFMRKLKNAFEGTGIDMVRELRKGAPKASGWLKRRINFNVTEDDS